MPKELCPACLKGDCNGHQYDFLLKNRVVVCKCNDPLKQHGKLREKKDA